MTDTSTLDETLLANLEAELNQPRGCTFRWKVMGVTPCGAPAAWVITTLCCGHVGYVCTPHREQALHLRRQATHCPGCGLPIKVGELENVYMIEPLTH